MFSNASVPPSLPAHFQGKWNQKRYVVLRELGRGANGAVYLVSHIGKKVALKVGTDTLDLLMEVNMLKEVQNSRDTKVGPLVCDVDDIVIQGKTYPFYAMEYIEGERLDDYVQRVGIEWVPILMVQLLSKLELLHSRNWVFGDLKPENVMVDSSTKQVCLIDFGGVTKKGNAVRQFTEDYDRGHWQAGDRKADPSYDLFSLCIMMIRLTIGRDLWKSMPAETRKTQLLCDIIRDNDQLYPFRIPLLKAIHGKYTSVAAMKLEIIGVYRERSHGSSKIQKKRTGGWLKWMGAAMVASVVIAGSIYVVWL